MKFIRTMLLLAITFASVTAFATAKSAAPFPVRYAAKTIAANQNITVDFTGYAGVVVITDAKGRTTIFDSANGLIQTQKVKVDGPYTITWTINPTVSTSNTVIMFCAPGVNASLLEQPGTDTEVVDSLNDTITFTVVGR